MPFPDYDDEIEAAAEWAEKKTSTPPLQSSEWLDGTIEELISDIFARHEILDQRRQKDEWVIDKAKQAILANLRQEVLAGMLRQRAFDDTKLRKARIDELIKAVEKQELFGDDGFGIVVVPVDHLLNRIAELDTTSRVSALKASAKSVSNPVSTEVA